MELSSSKTTLGLTSLYCISPLQQIMGVIIRILLVSANCFRMKHARKVATKIP